MILEKIDIVDAEVDAIVNAANGIGYMGGWIGKHIRLRGVAESLHYATRGTIERDAKIVARGSGLVPGDVYVTSAYNLSAKWILHAVTMKKPGLRSNIEIVDRCLDSVISECIRLGTKSVAIPLLGTGTGRLDVKVVLELYQRKLQDIKDFDITVVLR